jgi:hypothetical protein
VKKTANTHIKMDTWAIMPCPYLFFHCPFENQPTQTKRIIKGYQKGHKAKEPFVFPEIMGKGELGSKQKILSESAGHCS